MDNLENKSKGMIDEQFMPLQNDDFVIDVKGLFFALCKKWWIFMIVGILGAAIGFMLVDEPVVTSYRVDITMCVAPAPIEDKQLEVTDVTAANKLVPTYVELIKKSQMLDAIAVASDIGYEGADIGDLLSAYYIEDTNIFEIIVKANTKEDITAVVDAVVKVVPETLMETVPVGKIDIADIGRLETDVVTKSPIKFAIIGGVFAVVLVVAMISILELIKNPIRNEKDLEKALGIVSLGNVPQFTISRRAAKKLRNKRSRRIVSQGSDRGTSV